MHRIAGTPNQRQSAMRNISPLDPRDEAEKMKGRLRPVMGGIMGRVQLAVTFHVQK